MIERPIIFQASSVRAIRANTKFQTRRPLTLPKWAEGEIELDGTGYQSAPGVNQARTARLSSATPYFGSRFTAKAPGRIDGCGF